jgi:hypothetical protein
MNASSNDTSTMLAEVVAFMRASEALLSSASHRRALSEDECSLIAEYVTTLSASSTPWSKGLLVRYNS